MNNNRLSLSRFKSLILVLLIGLTSKVSAASILQSEVGTGFGLLETINRFLLFPLTTYQDLGIFIAIWAGFYYATKPILGEILSGMLEVFPSLGDDHGRHRSRNNTPDSVKRSVRGLSLVSGFVAAQYLGWTIGGLALIAIGSVSLVAIAVYMIWGTNGLFKELSGNGGNNATADGGTQARNPPNAGRGPGSSSGGDIPDELTDDISQMSQAISDLDERIDQIEAEDSNVMEELRQLKSEVEDLDNFEQQIPEMVSQGKLTEKQAQEVKRLIDDAEDLEQLEEKIEQNNEKLLQMEEKIESNEENIAELETLIAEMEEKAEEDLANTRQRLNTLRNQNEEVQTEIDQLEQQLQEGAIDRETYQQERAQLEQQFDTIKQELQGVQQQLQEAANEREQIKARIASLEDKMSGTLHIVGDLEERVKDLEKEESQGEQMAQKGEDEVSSVGGDLPNDVKNAIVGDMQDEETVLQDEEGETEDLEDLLKGEEGSLHVEQDTAEDEKAISERIDQEFVKLAQAAEKLEMSVKEEAQALQTVDQQERNEIGQEQKGITEIREHLTEMYQDNTNMSDQEIEQRAEKYLQQLQRLKSNTQDESQLGAIRESINLAKKMVDQEQQKMEAETETEQEAEQLAVEAQQVAGALSDPQEKTVVQEVERSFETAEQFLDPRNQKSAGQAEKFVWSQQEYVQEMDQLKQRQRNQGNNQAAQEIEKLETGLVDVLNKICEVRGIDRGQFGFLQ